MKSDLEKAEELYQLKIVERSGLVSELKNLGNDKQ